MRPVTGTGGAGRSRPLANGGADQAYTPVVRVRGRSKTRVAHCPTPYWVDLVRSGHGVYPPPADTTPAVSCSSSDRRCGMDYPWYYGVGCTCEDCLNNVRLLIDRERKRQGLLAGATDDDKPTLAEERPAELTPHGEALAELQAQNATLFEEELPGEDDEALLDQIAHYNATQEIMIFFGDGTAQQERR